jgi:lipopolysaccharide transport system ATP-binding protein
MTTVAFRADNLSKLYRLGVGADAHATLRETIMSGVGRLAGRREPARPGPTNDFWALKDVSFEVRTGEVLGILGSNGAGKSTLLKILSRIIKPTTGHVDVRGRLGALLEVGTGFHPDLTGRENIFLNGAVLGMSRAETARRLDAIIDFSGIEPFIDTPVKRYSSGMYLRLAFAVAAHIEPEILVIDEVLAVGDASFQAKCIGKVEEIAGSGRTVLFVSHQLHVVHRLCTRAILMQKGRLVADGSPSSVVETYLRGVEVSATQDLATRTDRLGEGEVRLTAVSVEAEGGSPRTGSPLIVRFTPSGEPIKVDCTFTIIDELGFPVATFDTTETSPSDAGEGTDFVCTIDALTLRPGRYRIDATLATHAGVQEDHIEGATLFDVQPGEHDGRSPGAKLGDGGAYLTHRWTRPA